MELLHGNIPVVLVPPNMILQTMSSIEETLSNKWPMFKIAVIDYTEIYALRDVKYHISDNNIYITVNFPITLQESLFSVYQVMAMPIA